MIGQNIDFIKKHPLRFILLLGITLRLAAVIFSMGYGMHDDHFLVIESAQSWIEGQDPEGWFSKTLEENNNGRNFLYTGAHYFLFKGLESIGIFDPQIKLFFVRLIHALLSMFSIYFGYRIVRKLSGEEDAFQVGILLAAFWLFPPMSVRTLVEIGVIPFLLTAVWLVLISEESKYKWVLIFVAGLLAGIAFPIRYQTLLFTAGIPLVLFFKKQWMEAILFGIGTLLIIVLTCGLMEWLVWGYPFGKLVYYIKDNLAHSGNYVTLPWFTFILQTLIVFIPPVSFFIFFGQFKVYKKYLLVFIPTLIFFAFHSYFPNKQERFIFTIYPFILMMGIPGWNQFLRESVYWQKKKKFIRGSWIFFWSLNTIVLLAFTLSYSKRSRVEAMYYFHDKKDFKNLIMEATSSQRDVQLPRFFADHKWPEIIYYSSNRSLASVAEQVNATREEMKPNYVLFLGDKDLEQRVSAMKTLYPRLQQVYAAEPSGLDWVLWKMNPINANQVIYVYKAE